MCVCSCTPAANDVEPAPKLADAVTDYVQFLRTHRKTGPNTESKLSTHVIPELEPSALRS